MPDLLIRNLESHTVEFFKARARGKGVSLQAEVQALLEEAEARERGERDRLIEEMQAIRKSLATPGRVFSDSGDLIREDRDER
ncbi:MAG: FitA-like ribbon-helix-helix domain-containing protein [Dehalococcoidia bacterium]